MNEMVKVKKVSAPVTFMGIASQGLLCGALKTFGFQGDMRNRRFLKGVCKLDGVVL